MKKWILTTCLLALIGMAQPASSGQFLKAHARGIPGRYIVVLKTFGLKGQLGLPSGVAETSRLADEITQAGVLAPPQSANV